ncbi:MotA/TolQ/ExbB proton channel family protein [Enhygromyxa salina]|uniref:Biopolymer transport protein ExbB n=1 Tax=Enhygromyxa salina TaxID=215803 RepID=A0A2S9Y157_9BACT|nr:MotA/TolQ/ExbB proton channel family protein [Enhygromyxa salina]PRP98819.1 Biopolymer transport protein ExbB [Enhygromyxa salina]
MDLNILHIWETMSLLSKIVAITLVIMGLGSAYVTIERVLVLRKAFNGSAVFAKVSRPLLDDLDLASLADLAKGKEYDKAPLAKLTSMGLGAYNRHAGASERLELARRDLERRLDELGAEARGGMGFLASVGSTAPFIGLFGTVIGIIVAFQGIAAAGGGGIEAVSAGIAEALIVTAMGLAVAITSVLIFNYLSARFDKLDMAMQHAAGELLDHLEAHDGRSA